MQKEPGFFVVVGDAMTSDEMRAMLDRKLRDLPRLRRQLVQSDGLDEFKEFRVKDALETLRLMLNGVRESSQNGRDDGR